MLNGVDWVMEDNSPSHTRQDLRRMLLSVIYF
jgi:hypothetical protein